MGVTSHSHEEINWTKKSMHQKDGIAADCRSPVYPLWRKDEAIGIYFRKKTGKLSAG